MGAVSELVLIKDKFLKSMRKTCSCRKKIISSKAQVWPFNAFFDLFFFQSVSFYLTTLLGRIDWVHLNWHPTFKHSLQTFNRVDVGALWRLFQKLNVSPLSIPKPVLMCAWDYCPVRAPRCVQVSTIWLMIWGEVEGFEGSSSSLNYIQCTSTSGSKTAPRTWYYHSHSWQLV